MTVKHNPSKQAETSLGLGFFFGVLAGIIGTFLFTSPEGAKLRQRLIKEFHQFKQARTLEEIGIVPASSDQAEANHLAKNLHNILHRLKVLINPNSQAPLNQAKKHIQNIPAHALTKKKHLFKVKN